MTGATTLVGLIGWPVAHSLSPAMHNAAFAALGLDWAYVPLPVAPVALGAALAGLGALGFVGANVTIPHKQAVVGHLAVVDELARAVGAVNTIQVRPDGGLVGSNSDVPGFLRPLDPFLPDLIGADAVVLGAGGAARAVVYGLLTTARLRRLTILARRPESAAALIGDFAALTADTELRVGSLDEATGLGGAALIVNTTPVGQMPHEGRSPVAADGWRSDQIAYDLVYHPLRTRFLDDAAAAGCRTIDGLGMLVGQAAVAFERWTGRTMPTDIARSAALAALSL